ncbi:MAG: hypothetical protein GX131_15715 [candidate division WS1 bacterium]|nr:hypothetical protein [candidate division WS1 bacterium]
MNAGFFEADVTPPVGSFLAGYPSRSEGSQGVDDPLYLRVIALEDDAGTRLVLLTADLLKWSRDLSWRTKLWAEAELGLPSASLVLNLSHTHSAPALFLQRCYPHWPVDREYLCRLEQTIREGIAAALDDLQPVRVKHGTTEAHFGVNRRRRNPETGIMGLGINEDGYYDPELPLFAFYRDNKLLGVLYSYACHSTSKSKLLISADWPGQIAQGLKQELGENVITSFAQGAAGSVMTRISERGDEEAYREYWREVARGIADFVRSDNMKPIELSLSSAEREFAIPYDASRLPTRDELMSMSSPFDTEIPDGYRPANRSIMRLWASDLLEQMRAGTVPEAFRMHLTHWRLNDALQLIAMSGEVTAEVGRAVKDLFPEQQTIFLGYCTYTDAYIPTAQMLPEGGHEALGSICFHERPAPFVPEIDDIIAREVRALIS